jgi:hypothetical protein
MADSREMAQLAFGDPGFFDFIAKGFKTIAPVLSFGAKFLPFGGHIATAIDAAAGLVADDPAPNPGPYSDTDDGDDF